MKEFIRDISLFLFGTTLFTLIIILFFSKIIDNGNYFDVKKDTKYIVLGHSHAECAFNDSLINGLENYAQSGESYFYTYVKTRKIIHSNKQIEAVFIEFTNNQIHAEKNTWIWGNKFLSKSYPKYSSCMNIFEILFLFHKNPGAVLNSQSVALKNNVLFILNGDSNYTKRNNWGGYKYLKRNKTDSLINIMAYDTIIKTKDPELSLTNIEYLSKTIEYCRKNGVKVYLIRSPLHSRYKGLAYELKFKEILITKFPNIEFLDFKDFPLQNTDFGDLEHLNYKGAEILSEFFNKLLVLNLLERENKQEFINQQIELIKDTNAKKQPDISSLTE